MEEWKEYKLGEVCNTISDTYKGNAENVVLINTSDVLEGKCLNHIKTPNKDLKGQFKKTFQKDDILYSEIRPANKRYAYIDFDATDYIASTKLMVIRHNERILPQYLFYKLKNQAVLDELQMLAESRSGTFPQITFSEVANLEIKLPPIEQQHRILGILKSLDDKIEVNRKINENLEQQAQALFKSWFVDFEPFKDGEFEESELGMIPKGWRVGAIGDYCKVRSGYAFKSSWWSNSGIPVVKIKNITDDGRLDMTDSSFVSNEHADLAKEFQTKVGDLLIAMTGATIGKFCIVHSNNKLCVNQRVGKFFLGENPLKKLPFVYYNLRRPNVFEEIVRRGQGSAQPNISGKDIETISIIYPSEEIISQFNILLYSLFEKIICNLQESRRLATLRDTLLPKLMSGELKVNDMRLSEKQ
jgi:type I restriction enzyme S subunit